MSRSRETPPPFRLPWLVTQRDLHRYLSRALDACERGHVLLFWHRQSRNKRMLLSLVPHTNWEQRLAQAMVAYRGARYRRVTLKKLPRTRWRITE